jgi:antitoxin CptB
LGGNSGGPAISSEGLDGRRRRVLFRCWHRGIREMDLVYGRFADAEIANLSAVELDELDLRRPAAGRRIRHAFVPPPAGVSR